MVRLSDRMKALARQVNCGGVLADIGTDHGYLPIYLLKEGKIDRAIAMDLKQGPLSRARENVEEEGLQEKIELRLSDGLTALSAGEADTILIAGMGGGLMQRILKAGDAVAKPAKELVLQPQSEIAEFRRFLADSGYGLLDEDAVFEDGKYYFIMRASAGKGIVPKKAEEMAFGPILLKNRHPVLLSHIEHEIGLWERNQKALQGRTPSDAIENRRREIGERLALLYHTRQEYF